MAKILITGSRGMVGRSICEQSEANLHKILNPSSTELNLLNIEAIESYLENEKPDMIIHSAGVVGGITANIAEPTKFFFENLQMGINLVSKAKKAGVKNFLNIASSCIYPRNIQNPLNESLILKGELEPTNEGYALAKICVEKFCKYISSENAGFKYKTLVPCNIFGKYDKFDPQVAHMLPAIINRIHTSKIKNKTLIKIWGDGKARREFMYSEDLANAIWFCVEKIDQLPQTLNIGMGRDYSVFEYYDQVSKVINLKCNYVYDLSKPVGMNQKLLDSSLINKLGWNPKFSLIDGIKATYNYFLSLNIQ